MSELMAVREAIPSLIQTLGLIAPAIACCYVNLSRRVAFRYVTSWLGKDYHDTTGLGLRTMTQVSFKAHDHQVGGLKPDTTNRKPGKSQLVVEIPKGDTIDLFLVRRDEVEIIQELQPGQQISGVETPLIHNHDGKMATGPWEHS